MQSQTIGYGMTVEERQAEIVRLREQYRSELSTPLVSEGGISPVQIGRMSKKQHQKWQNDAQTRMVVEAEIRDLKRSDEVINAEEAVRVADYRRGRIMQIDSVVSLLSRQVNAKGKVFPKYQREIDKLTAEKIALLQA